MLTAAAPSVQGMEHAYMHLACIGEHPAGEKKWVGVHPDYANAVEVDMPFPLCPKTARLVDPDGHALEIPACALPAAAGRFRYLFSMPELEQFSTAFDVGRRASSCSAAKAGARKPAAAAAHAVPDAAARKGRARSRARKGAAAVAVAVAVAPATAAAAAAPRCAPRRKQTAAAAVLPAPPARKATKRCFSERDDTRSSQESSGDEQKDEAMAKARFIELGAPLQLDGYAPLLAGAEEQLCLPLHSASEEESQIIPNLPLLNMSDEQADFLFQSNMSDESFSAISSVNLWEVGPLLAE